MKVNEETRTVTLGDSDCWHCRGKGFSVAGKAACEQCGGTGNGPRGGKGGCRKCHGMGWNYAEIDPYTCEHCNGTGIQPEKMTDTVSIPDIVEWRVEYQDRAQSFAEAYIGVGLFSCTDYGRHWQVRDDEQLIREVSDRPGYIQICKIVRESDMRLCDEIVIQVHPLGYTSTPVWRD